MVTHDITLDNYCYYEMARKRLGHVRDPVQLGIRLKAARLAAGVSQAKLAAGVCSASYVAHIEHAARVPSLQILRLFAQRLATSEGALLGIDDGVGDSARRFWDSVPLDQLVRRRLDAEAGDPRAQLEVVRGLVDSLSLALSRIEQLAQRGGETCLGHAPANGEHATSALTTVDA